MPNPVPAAVIGLPSARLLEVHDHIVLALDVSERQDGYSRPEREARGYLRQALRHTRKLMEAGHAAA